MLVALMLFTGAARAAPALCESKRPIIFAGLNWESGEFLTAVMQEIIERGFGCQTDTIPGNTMTFEQALANDDIQLVAEEWVDRSEIWRKAASADLVVAVGRAFTEATEGWAVPEYVINGDATRGIAPMAPDLRSVSQLSDAKYVELFQDTEQPGRGRFLNCPSGWTCEPENTAKIHAYGLDNFYVDFRPGTGPAMDAAIKSAYLQGRPALFYYWSPSAIAGSLKIVPLREPPYTPNCWEAMHQFGAPPTGGCASPPSVVVYGASKPFAVTAPQIVGVLSKATFRLSELNENLATMADQKREPRVQAVAFLNAHPETWTTWVDATLAARIQASLRPQAAGSAPGTPTSRFPTSLVLSIREPVNSALATVVIRYGAVFRHISQVLLSIILAFDTVVSWIPWWLLIGGLMVLAWMGTRRWLPTGMIGGLMLIVGMLGLWDLMLQTLTLMLISSLVAVALGLPLGIAAAKARWFRSASFSVLDVMQTMPSFVYLIPALMLFGLGKVPALIATVIYALPPMIRLTALGIEQVPGEIKEAATAFGVTPLQMLSSVELPLARPSIMAGINQTIMLSLSMVVIASMIGARGLGEQVLNGIQSLDIGKGLEAGIGIVILAVVLDRVTQGVGAIRRGALTGAEERVSKIELRGVTKVFGRDTRHALRLATQGVNKMDILARTGCTVGLCDVNLEIPGNEIFVLMGLSGSGKSTLIRHLNRLIEPSRGAIVYEGDDITRYSNRALRDFRRRSVSMVFQGFGLLPHRTVLQNVAFGLTTRGEEREQVALKARQWIDTVGLSGYEAKYPNQLSGGMRQRVGLARALATESSVILMDEAFSALDPLIRLDMQDLLIGLHSDFRKTIIFVTHDLDEAVRIGARIAVMRDGRIIQVGTPAYILNNPADEYVARFVQARNAARDSGVCQ